jgi:hypothetical protein
MNTASKKRVSGALVETGCGECQFEQAARAEGRTFVTRFATLVLMSAAAITALSACATKPVPPPGVHPSVEVGPTPKSAAWKAIATAEDQNRLSRLGLAWQEALDEANKSNAAEVHREGKLLSPKAGLPRPDPTPGSYNCRLIKLGSAVPKAKPYEIFKPFFCYVEIEGDQLTIIKQTGSQRPAGSLWEDDDPTRLIFLGSLALGDEEQPLAYGDDPKRNMAGVLERISPFRWRLVIPWPQSSSKLDVFELTPVAQQPQG